MRFIAETTIKAVGGKAEHIDKLNFHLAECSTRIEKNRLEDPNFDQRLTQILVSKLEKQNHCCGFWKSYNISLQLVKNALDEYAQKKLGDPHPSITGVSEKKP